MHEGGRDVMNQPKTEELRPIVLSLFELLPSEDRETLKDGWLH